MFVKLAVTAVLILGAAVTSPAVQAADPWPTRPVKFIIPYPAGGGADPMARAWAERLNQLLGQPFVIDNRGGASGTIGAEAVAKSAPDGYTFLFTPNAPITVNRQFRTLPYDSVTDLTPVARVGDIVSGFTTQADAPYSTIGEMIAFAKANPGKLAYGSPGPGSATHIRLEMLKLRTGADITYVPYKGAAETVADLLAGTIQLTQDPILYPHIRAGKLKMLAVNHPTRNPDFPAVPTLTEAGVANADIPIWCGLYAPAKTPSEIIEKLNRTIVGLADDADLIAKLRQYAVLVPKQSPTEMAAFIQQDMTTIAGVIRDAKIKLE